MYSFKRIDAVARKKINLSRHQAQEQLQRRMGVNCESLTMPALQMDFSVCVSYWDAGCMRGEEGREKGLAKKKAILSAFIQTLWRGNFDPLALSFLPWPIFHLSPLSQDLFPGKIPLALMESVFNAKCARIHICWMHSLPTNTYCCLSRCEIVCRCLNC